MVFEKTALRSIQGFYRFRVRAARKSHPRPPNWPSAIRVGIAECSSVPERVRAKCQSSNSAGRKVRATVVETVCEQARHLTPDRPPSSPHPCRSMSLTLRRKSAVCWGHGWAPIGGQTARRFTIRPEGQARRRRRVPAARRRRGLELRSAQIRRPLRSAVGHRRRQCPDLVFVQPRFED
jgi:hypothetical protein